MIAIKAQFDARFLATGTLEKVKRVEYANGTKELLNITLNSDGNYFTYTMFNTKKEPQRIQSLMTKLRKGDLLKASGTVAVREYEDKQGNVQNTINYSAFATEHLGELTHPRVFITVAGILKKKVDKEEMGGKEITIRVFDDYNKQNQEYTFSVDEKMEQYYEDINEGDNISVTAQYINQAVAEVSSNVKSYGEEIDDIVPAGMKRTYERKINVISGSILAEESELDEEDEIFDIDNDDIPF